MWKASLNIFESYNKTKGVILHLKSKAIISSEQRGGVIPTATSISYYSEYIAAYQW